jgi:hypothetical protein
MYMYMMFGDEVRSGGKSLLMRYGLSATIIELFLQDNHPTGSRTFSLFKEKSFFPDTGREGGMPNEGGEREEGREGGREVVFHMLRG